MGQRQDYVIRSSCDDPDLAAVCAAVWDAVESRATVVHIDAISDHRAMPDDVRAAEAWLQRRAVEQHGKATSIRAEVEPHEEPGWAFARAYTPWSIDVDVFDADDRGIASFHDCGHSIIALLLAAEADALATVMPPGHEIEPLIVFREREREQSRATHRGRVRNALRFRR